MASLREIGVKIRVGKLNIPTDPAFFQHHHRQLQCDRLLIAQARVEYMTLVTRDEQIRACSVPTLW